MKRKNLFTNIFDFLNNSKKAIINIVQISKFIWLENFKGNTWFINCSKSIVYFDISKESKKRIMIKG